MQTSGDRRREIAKSYSVVIVREGGRSSIPKTSVIEPRSRSVLDPPHSRGMAAEDDARPTKQNGGSYPAASNSVIAG